MSAQERERGRGRRFVVNDLLTERTCGRLLIMHKTALRLDEELLSQARDLLGTKTTTETVHAALAEVVARRGRERLFERLRRRDGTDLADDSVMAQAWR